MSRWTDIEKDVLRNIVPAIKRALGDRFQYTDTELKKVLQNLHRHQRDSYAVSLNPLKSKANKWRTGTNSRRKDVSISFNICSALVGFESWNKWWHQVRSIFSGPIYWYDRQLPMNFIYCNNLLIFNTMPLC